jgi:AraC-like DNA-binding protein
MTAVTLVRQGRREYEAGLVGLHPEGLRNGTAVLSARSRHRVTQYFGAVMIGHRHVGRIHRAAGWATRDRRGTIAHVTGRPDPHLRDLKLLRSVRDRIDREYAQPLNVEALARGVNMSAGHLSRQFKIAYGESPYSYLMTRRIERAMALLRRGDLSVTEVCFAVGCQSLGTFSTRFTELVGMPPSTYREQTARVTEGIPSCVEKQVTRPIRNREAPVTGLHLA